MYQRLRPSKWLLREVEVEGGASQGFNVTLETLNCDSDLPLFSIGHAQVRHNSLMTNNSPLLLEMSFNGLQSRK